jgi:hypothetical protein
MVTHHDLVYSLYMLSLQGKDSRSEYRTIDLKHLLALKTAAIVYINVRLVAQHVQLCIHCTSCKDESDWPRNLIRSLFLTKISVQIRNESGGINTSLGCICHFVITYIKQKLNNGFVLIIISHSDSVNLTIISLLHLFIKARFVIIPPA